MARLYPSYFSSSKWIYSSIGVKNIGYFIYTRIIFKIDNQFYQGIVRSTHGVENSQTLISWDRIFYGVDKSDYGYGFVYTINYGYSPKYFYDYTGNSIVGNKLVLNVV